MCDDQSREVVIGSWTPIPYIAPMTKTVRCFLAALLLLVFGEAPVLAAIQSGDMSQPAVEASVDQAMPGACSDCGDNGKAMTTTACSALGTCLQAVESLTTSSLPGPDGVLYPPVVGHISGYQGSPDPFPPKAYILP